MYSRQYEFINTDLRRTRAAVIGMGCSFVEGQGAFDDEMYEMYHFEVKRVGRPAALDISVEELRRISIQYDIPFDEQTQNVNWTVMEYRNAFVNVLCSKYLFHEYTPINLGLRGHGNRATIKEVYAHPAIDWHLIDKLIVVWMPSGLERFDFVSDMWFDAAHWACLWPQPENVPVNKPRYNMWKGYKEAIWSDKSEVLEQIMNACELQTWCQAHNADLIITPAFDTRYTREYFLSALRKNYHRTCDWERQENPYIPEWHNENFRAEHLIDSFPWNNFFRPQDFLTFSDFTLQQEGICGNNIWEWLGIGTPKRWMTPCCHPSAKAHDLYAKLLSEYLVNQQIVT